MKKNLESIIHTLEKGQTLMFVSILKSSGSTPRRAGATMLVFEDGHMEGTIGGGPVEYAAHKHAQKLLAEGTSDIVHYELNKNKAADLGMICGGDVTVYFQYVEGTDNLPFFCRLRDALSYNQNAWLIWQIEGNDTASMGIVTDDSLSGALTIPDELLTKLLRSSAVYLEGTPAYYAIPCMQAGTVYLFGGGHVAQELVPLLSRVGFSVIVFEDREAFADPALFPDAKKVILGDFQKIDQWISFTEHDYAVIMTRGHQADFEILAQVLKHPLSYMGCIGSRTKIALSKQRLLELGVSEHLLSQIHAPIGLSIKAETPAEIAVSIVSEMILHRATVRKGE